MNELKAVLKHLEDKEVKLSSEKVELGVMQDMKKLADSADSLASKAFGELQKVAENLSKLANKYEAEAKKFESGLKDVMDKYASAAKDLGLDGYKNHAAYTNATQSLEQMQQLNESGRKISSAVKGGAIGNL